MLTLIITQYICVIDQGQDGWILAKFFFCVFMDLDFVSGQAWSIKDLLYGSVYRQVKTTKNPKPISKQNMKLFCSDRNSLQPAGVRLFSVHVVLREDFNGLRQTRHFQPNTRWRK